MNTVALTNQLYRPEMTLHTIEPAQYTAAKVAGFLHLLMMVTGMFAELYALGLLLTSS